MLRKIIRKLSTIIVISTIFAFLLSVPSAAWSPEELRAELENGLPSAVRDKMPSLDESTVSEALGLKFYLQLLGESLSGDAKPLLSLFLSLFGFLLLASLLSRIGQGKTRTVSTLLPAVTALFAYKLSENSFRAAETFLEDAGTLAELFAPIFGGLYAAGGNTAAAVVSGSTFTVFLFLSEVLCSDLLLPLSRLIFAFSLVGVGGECDLSGISATLRKTYTTVILLLTSLLFVTLPARELLAAGSDGVAARTLKYAVANMIPVVGGGISAGLGSVTASVALLRSLLGGASVVAVLILTLPTVLHLLAVRLLFSFAGGIGKALGVPDVAAVFENFSGIYDMFLATVALSSVSLILLSAMLARCAVAI